MPGPDDPTGITPLRNQLKEGRSALKPNPIPSPQHAPVLALLALVTEHPELRASWRLADDGHLMGDARVDADGRRVMDRFVAVLGGRPLESQYAAPSDPGDLVWSSWLWTSWRDVELSVTVSCPAILVNCAVPAPALPAAWSAKAVA